MPLQIGWHDIALRLGLAFVAGFLIGRDRDKRREAAGLRTNLLVCLAAAVSMVQVNLLLGMEGKNPGSFAVMDLMRLPLGILTGMGFIGGGAILKKGDLVLGVTTAASLWFTTVIGLCFGGGQIGLGLVSLALALFTLAFLRKLEERDRLEHRGFLYVAAPPEFAHRERIQEIISQSNAVVISCSVSHRRAEGLKTYEFEVGLRRPAKDGKPPSFVEDLDRDSSLSELRWLPEVMSRRSSNRSLE